MHTRRRRKKSEISDETKLIQTCGGIKNIMTWTQLRIVDPGVSREWIFGRRRKRREILFPALIHLHTEQNFMVALRTANHENISQRSTNLATPSSAKNLGWICISGRVGAVLKMQSGFWHVHKSSPSSHPLFGSQSGRFSKPQSPLMRCPRACLVSAVVALSSELIVHLAETLSLV